MADPDPLRLRFAEFELDEADARLMRGGQPVALPPKAFAVLCALARQNGQLVTKNALIDAVWGHQFISESVLKTTVSELRAALADDAKQPRYIETAARRGYRFIAAATPLAARGAAATTNAASAESLGATLPPTHETPPIVGRQAALHRLRHAWTNASAARRQVVWVAGEAGIGKTTLIDTFTAALGTVTSAQGQCVEQYGTGEPYLPVLEALGALCRRDATLAPMLRSIAPTWLLQLPWLTNEAEREALRRELAGANQDRMLRELGELLDRYTQDRPLLLVTEDLHWSDHATVHLINHIARRRGPARLMWLASFRLAEVIAEEHPLKSLRHELRLHRLCEEIVLEPFSEQEVADYIEERFPDLAVSESLVRALHTRTDGLPLFVANVIDDLVSQGVLGEQGDEAPTAAQFASLEVPESLAGVIEKQIERLSADERALLETASVCGVEFRPSTVAGVLDQKSDAVAACCDVLARRQQWLSSATLDGSQGGSPGATYAFRHALYRHVFYQRIGPARRAQLHRGVATALERERQGGATVTAAELASHCERGHDFMTALGYYAQAADNALRHFAPREAMDLSAHGLELLPRCPEGPHRLGLELALAALQGAASAQALGVSAVQTKRAFERARGLLEHMPQHPLRTMVLHGLGLVLFVRGEFAEARALGERLLAMSETYNDPILLIAACNLLGQIDTLGGKPQAARELLERGIAAGESVGDAVLQAAYIVDPIVTMHAVLSLSLLHVGLADQGRAQIDRSHARAERLGQPMAKLVAMWFNALFESRLHNLERVGELAEQMHALVEQEALAQGVGPSRWYRGWAQSHRGEPQAGYQLIREAYEHNVGLGMLAGAAEVIGYGAEALILAGEFERAQIQLEEAAQLAERLGERAYLPQLFVSKGRAAQGRGDRTAAREATLAAVNEARAQQAPWLELNALLALCKLDEPRPEDFDALASVRARLAEGLDAPLVRSADALLRGRGDVTSPAGEAKRR